MSADDPVVPKSGICQLCAVNQSHTELMQLFRSSSIKSQGKRKMNRHSFEK